MTNFRSAAIATGNLIDDSAYDDVKLVSDNIAAVQAVGPAYSSGDLTTVANDIASVVTLAGVSAAIASLYADKATLDSLYADKITLDSLFADKATLDAIHLELAAIASVYADKATIDSIVADKLTLDSIYADKATLDSLYADKLTLDSLYADKGTLDSLLADKAKLDSLFADKATLDSIYADKITLDSLFADKLTLDRINTSIAKIDRVYTSIANLDTVYASIANVDAVAGNQTNVDTVATAIANVNAVGTNIANVNAVNANATNINTVAANDANITTVATNDANVTTVADSIASINTVANVQNLADIVTVAEDLNALDLNGIADVTIVANDLVLGVDSNVTKVGTDIASVNTVAANIADINNFGKVYFGSQTVAPTIGSHPDLSSGDLYFDTILNEMRVFDGSVWKNAGSTVNGTTQRETFTAIASQTIFVVTGGYDSGYADVYMNGMKLINGVDVDVSSGTQVLLTVGAQSGDIIDVVAYGTFELADHYSKSISDVKHRSVPLLIKATEDLVELDVVQGTGYNQGEDALEVGKTVVQTDIALGVVGVDISNGSFAEVITKGIIENVNTSAWAFGDILYSNGSGGFTNIKPAGTYQALAYVIKNHAVNGAILVDVTEPVSVPTLTSLGLENVDNTSDVNKPVSTAQQSALDLKAPIASPTFTGTVSGVDKTMVGLSNVDNTTDLGKPISTATQTALDGKQPIDTVLTNTTASYTTAEETKLAIAVVSDDTESGASQVLNIVQISQANYDLLTPVATTVYIIV